MDQITQYLNKCNYIKAKQLLETEIGKDPTNSDALMYLGDVYFELYGKGYGKDGLWDKTVDPANIRHKFMFLYTEAAKLGNIYAMLKIGNYYNTICSSYLSGIPDKYFEQAEVAIENSNLETDKRLFYLGCLQDTYYNNINNAIKYLEQTLTLDSSISTDILIKLVSVYNRKYYITQNENDKNKAIQFYKYVYDLGIIPTADTDYFIIDEPTTLSYFKKAAINGNIKAMKFLAYKFPDQAKKWYQKAVDELDPEAMLKLAELELDLEKKIYYVLQAYRLTDIQYILDKASTNIIDLILKNQLILLEENKKLKDENIELKYRPGGKGYKEAKQDFENLCQS